MVNFATLSGVGLIGAQAHKAAKTMQGLLNGFAAGALLACALFLMLLESHALIKEWESPKDEDDIGAAWRWGDRRSQRQPRLR